MMRVEYEYQLSGERMNRSERPKHLLMQWHITDRCNLRCQHCYQEGYSDEGPDFAQMLGILDQYEILLAALGNGNRRIPGQINITGGEPFVRKDFLHLLREIRRRRIPFAILSNGSFIDQATASFLKALAPRFIQLSLEGTQIRHDTIRGDGDYARVLDSLRILKESGIRTLISFTAHRENFREFPEIADLCRRNGITRLWADRLIPLGAGDGGYTETLSPEETESFFQLMAASTKRRWYKIGDGAVSMRRALQFLVSGKQPYRCNAGYGLITVMPDGTVLPCRRLPIPAGNIFDTSLTNIYFESKVLQELRNPANTGKGCETCPHQTECSGGLRCLAYSMTGDPYRADPGCWLATQGADN